jgi:hypothetical protein
MGQGLLVVEHRIEIAHVEPTAAAPKGLFRFRSLALSRAMKARYLVE